nr:EAL domain-containing protein [Bacilli bacterium]
MGKYQLSITSPDLNSQAYRSFRLGKDLHQAILHNQFVLYYQPRVDAKTFEVVSGEALLRWQHPEFGMVSPAEFIPLAEATGLIVKLGEWVIEQVLLAYQSWQTITCENFTLSLNVSGEQLINFGFQDRVDALFSRAGIDRQAIEFEITESLFTDRHDQFQTTIHSLQVQGNRIALDDFGTGFSSLSRLKDLPCEVLKIDRSFVLHISIREDDRIIVEAVIKLAHALGMTVVAEGVETIEQLRLLQEVDCDGIQGYLFSRPVPAEQFEQILLGKKITIG